MSKNKAALWKKILFALVALVIIIQFIPVDHSNPEPDGELTITGEVGELFDTACMDCHSHNTEWPWYSYVAPVSWLISYDVHHAREYFNLSVWETYSYDKKDHLLKDVVEVMETEEMPLDIYTITHADARLSDEQRQSIISWAETKRAELNKKITADGSEPGSDETEE